MLKGKKQEVREGGKVANTNFTYKDYKDRLYEEKGKLIGEKKAIFAK